MKLDISKVGKIEVIQGFLVPKNLYWIDRGQTEKEAIISVKKGTK